MTSELSCLGLPVSKMKVTTGLLGEHCKSAWKGVQRHSISKLAWLVLGVHRREWAIVYVVLFQAAGGER